MRGDALYQNAKSRLALFPSRTGMCMSLLSAPRKRWGLHFLRNVGEKSAKKVSKGMEENAAKAGKKTCSEDILLKPPKSKCWLVAG